MLLGIVLVAVLFLLLLITKLKLNPFIALILVSFFVRIGAGMLLDKLVASIQAGLGNTLGFIAIVLGLGTSLNKAGLPLLAGLSVVHGLVPPHPAAMAAVGIFNANVGKTIFYSIIVGLPTAILAGPV